MVINNKIFISIACFMDPDIVNTIDDCLSKALYPKNITFGVCLQYDPSYNFFEKYDNHPQVKLIKMQYTEAKGPAYARYFCNTLLTDEEYFLQIDCHTRFFQDWDSIAINNWKLCDDEKGILTNFPIPILRMSEYLSWPLNRSTKKFQSLSMENIKLGSETCGASANKLYNTYYLSAALIFGKSLFIKEVPYDPALIYSYQPIEQQFYAVRLFTHGWNLYVPNQHILATLYEKTPHYDSNNKKISAPTNATKNKLAWKRVLYYYGLCSIEKLDNDMKKDISLYGLGSNRTLEEYFNIHGEENVIEKLKDGSYYKDKTWHNINTYTYECSNPIFNSIISENNSLKISSLDNKTDFVWIINPTTIDHKLQHYPQATVAFIDNKKSFYQLLKENNITKGVPKTYFHVDELEEASNKNYFLKYAGNNGGKQVHMYNNITDIKNHLLNDNRPYIIQEEIENMLLIDKKKFVIRNWVVIINNEFYLTTNGCCIIHVNNYDKTNLDRMSHIEHDISKVGYQCYNKTSFYKNSFEKLRDILKEMCNTISNKLCFKDNCFQVLGLDIILDDNNDPYVIEINSWPCMNVPYGEYKILLHDFFSNFLSDIVIKKLRNEPIIENDYFIKINTIKPDIFNEINNKSSTENEGISFGNEGISFGNEGISFGNEGISFGNDIYDNTIQSIVINLENAPQKYSSISNKLTNFGFHHKRFNGINGNDIYESFKNNNKFLNNGYNLRPHQIGCWQSHYNIWEKMVEKNVDKLFILEDDCLFVNDFKEMYEKTLFLLKDKEYDIVFLGYSGCNVDVEKELYLINRGVPRCTHSYILTQSGAKKLVEKLKIIDYPIDETMGRMFYRKELNGYRTSYVLSYQPWQRRKDKYPLPSKYTNEYNDLI